MMEQLLMSAAKRTTSCRRAAPLVVRRPCRAQIIEPTPFMLRASGTSSASSGVQARFLGGCSACPKSCSSKLEGGKRPSSSSAKSGDSADMGDADAAAAVASSSSLSQAKIDDNGVVAAGHDAADGLITDPQSAFGMLSNSVHRGFKFDRMFPSDDLDPQTLLALDQVAMVSMKTQIMPKPIIEKIVNLLRDFGQKKNLERYGKYMMKRVRSRTSAEVPTVLKSVFLPEYQDDAAGPMGKLRKNPLFKDLFNHADVTMMNDSTLGRLAKAQTEDGRHRLYQSFWSPESSLTYLAHRFPGAWAANFRVLRELALRAPNFVPRRVLDYGAGPSPALAAVAEVWPDKVEFAAAIEPSDHMSQLGKHITEGLALPEVQWQRCLYDVVEKYDLIIASYVQMEVKAQPSRDALVKQLWNRLSPGGVLVLIENGTPTGFRFMHHTRELFITKIGTSGFHFVAPCPHEKMCPLAVTGRDWCHFAQRVRRTPHYAYCKGSKARFLEEEKFTFLCIRKSVGPRELYHSEAAAPTLHEKSYFWPRVLFPAIKRGGHTHIDVCTAPHNFERLSVSLSKPHSFGYRFSRRVMWGDLWRFPKRVTRPEARLYVAEETRAHLDRLAKKAWAALKWDEGKNNFRDEKEMDEQYYGQ